MQAHRRLMMLGSFRSPMQNILCSSPCLPLTQVSSLQRMMNSQLMMPCSMLLSSPLRMFSFSSQQATSNEYRAFRHNQISDNKGSRRYKKQLGRGNGSGKGKTSGRGHKGQYARSGGKINRGFEGGQTSMIKRFPKRGFRVRRFNNGEFLEQISLGKLAYFIEKGQLDHTQPITMKVLLESGVLTSIKQGVKVLGNGSERLLRLGVPISLEVSDATSKAVEAIGQSGGAIKMVYRPPLAMRQFLKPHKFEEYQNYKTPMPSPKRLKKLEKLKEKGIEVEYPDAPWFSHNLEAIQKEREAAKKRISEAQNAKFLEKLPADRSPGVSRDKPRMQRPTITKTIRLV